LRTVYRRGVGSYGIKVRSESRETWAMRRVNDFLHAMRKGEPRDMTYVQDNDLLPSDHKWVVHSEKLREVEFSEVKRIGSKLRRMKPARRRVMQAIFNRNARDADGDGVLQEGTQHERPATPKGPKKLSKLLRRRKRKKDEAVNLADEIKKLKTGDEGFTIKLSQNRSLKSGWAIARQNKGIAVPLSTMFKDGKSTREGRLLLMAFIDEHLEELMGGDDEKGKTAALGAWHNPATGLIHLDVTDVYDKDRFDKDAAIEIGRKQNQISIADLDLVQQGDYDNAFPESGGDGGDVYELSEFENRMREILREQGDPNANKISREELRPSTRMRSETGPEDVEMAIAEPVGELAKKHGEARDWAGVVAIDPERRKAIADFYDESDSPSRTNASEEIIAAYEALAREVDEQYEMLVNELGVKVEFVDDDPYDSFEEMRRDYLDNKRIKIMRTEVTGSHPFLTDDQNDKFRAVHDAFGHLGTGRGFDRHGEEAAYQAHRTMFGKEAVKALASETRGQNQFLLDRGYFGEQKLVLLPEEMRKSLRFIMALLTKSAKRKDQSSKIEKDSDADNAYISTRSHHTSGGRVRSENRVIKDTAT